MLLLTAHFGNWEAAGQLLTRLDVPINVTGFDNESGRASAPLLEQSSKAKFRLLPLTGSPTDAIPLVAALRRGEVVAMLGDRPYGRPSTRVPFLGGEASFPIGAYVLAAIAGAPLVHVFSLREAGRPLSFLWLSAPASANARRGVSVRHICGNVRRSSAGLGNHSQTRSVAVVQFLSVLGPRLARQAAAESSPEPCPSP